jgi:hypothetical protein
MKKLVKSMLIQGLFMLALNHCIYGQQIVDVNLKNSILTACNTCLDNNGNLLAGARTITNLEIGMTQFPLSEHQKDLKGLLHLKNLVS